MMMSTSSLSKVSPKFTLSTSLTSKIQTWLRIHLCIWSKVQRKRIIQRPARSSRWSERLELHVLHGRGKHTWSLCKGWQRWYLLHVGWNSQGSWSQRGWDSRHRRYSGRISSLFWRWRPRPAMGNPACGQPTTNRENAPNRLALWTYGDRGTAETWRSAQNFGFFFCHKKSRIFLCSMTYFVLFTSDLSLSFQFSFRLQRLQWHNRPYSILHSQCNKYTHPWFRFYNQYFSLLNKRSFLLQVLRF